MAFSASTRVGNWSEDGEAKAALTAQLLAARESGTLRSDAHSALLAAALAPVATTPPQPDGLLRFGDVRVLASSTGGALAACTRDALNPPAARAAAAALSASSSPVARSCVVLESIAPRSVEDEGLALARSHGADVVHYGQKLRVRLCAEGCADAPRRLRSDDAPSAPPALVLRSVPVTGSCYARKSKHGEVSWAATNPQLETAWVIVCPDPALQRAAEGQAVMVGAPVLLRHVGTQGCLHAEHHAILTDFGAGEREVSVFSAVAAGHTDALAAVRDGRTEGAATKALAQANVWHFV